MNPLNEEILIRVPQRMGKIQEGTQEAKLIDLDTGMGQYGKYAKFVFEVTGEGGKKCDIPYFASLKIAPAQGNAKESKLFTVLKALQKDALIEGNEIDLSKLRNKTCRVRIAINNESGYPTITDIMPN